MKQHKYPSVLTIAGFDGSGGAGLQADIKTISALGCYATSVLTALPVQNTTGVRNIYEIPIDAVSEQLAAIFEDIVPDAIKIGMVHTTGLVSILSEAIMKYPGIPVVFDPVMVATSGHRLMEEGTITAIVEKLFPLAEIITPNMDEAAVLAQMEVKTTDDMYQAAERIRNMGCHNLLLKGGHGEGSEITSIFADKYNKVYEFKTTKFVTPNTHGSGCTLSSAIAAFRARDKDLLEAVTLGQQFVFDAIKNGTDVQTGKGNGPLNHFFNPLKLIKNEM